MLLAIDAGNTNIAFAVFDGARVVSDWRIGTVVRRTGDEYAALMSTLLRERGLSLSDVDAAAICSVVPAGLDALARFAREHLRAGEPLVLSPEMDLGIRVHYFPITDVGPDRLANAVAAHARYEGPVIVVDLGTGVTLDAVSADGEYLGGAIAPGIEVSLEALFSRAAHLRRIRLAAPAKAIGDTTTASLQSGIMFGYAGMVDALVERFRQEMGGDARVVATGGHAGIIAEHSRTIESVDELLTLNGIRLVYERAARK